jgi:hypothetical protein
MTILLFALFTTNVFAVCMTKDDADFEGNCISMESSSSDKWCQKKYGSDFYAYYTTNSCSKKIAYESRDEVYTATQSDLNGTTEASCMTYEDGTKNNCTLYEYDNASRFCNSEYGSKFLAFIPTKACSMKKASTIRGEVNSKELVNNLASDMEEAEAVMTMLDKSGIASSIGGGFFKEELTIKEEFYTNTVKTVMAKLSMIKKQMLVNGKKNISIKGKFVPEYLKYGFRYLSVLSRLYKLYAYVAHQNHFVLKTYNYNNLSELNLKLKKKYALELISRVNFQVRTVDNGENIEFAIGEQDKQTLEYMAIEKPTNKLEYGKLITFLGARETLTNLWAVQRLTNTKISNPIISSCGRGFLSLRPNSRGDMSQSKAMKDLWTYDIFYNDYSKYWDKLIDATSEISILDNSSAQELNYNVMTKVKELKHFMTNEMFNPFTSDSEFKARAKDDAAMRVMTEESSWQSFSYGHITTIVMPGDNILSKDSIANRIFEDAYKVRIDAIINNFQGSYPYVSKTGLANMESYIKSYIDLVHRDKFKAKLTLKVKETLRGYNNQQSFRRNNRVKKVNDTFDAAKLAARAAYIQDHLRKKDASLKGLKLLSPTNMSELMMLFEKSLEKNDDIRITLEKNQKMADLLGKFLSEVTTEFMENHSEVVDEQKQYKGSADERSRGLRNIAFKIAKKYHQIYPFNFKSRRLIDKNLFVVARDNTYVNKEIYMPVYRDGTPALLPKKNLLKQFDFDKKRDLKKDYYTTQRDNTRVAMKPIFTGVIKNSKSNKKGWNKDKITTGETSIPNYISKDGSIVAPKGTVGKINNELLQLVKQMGVLNKKSVKKLETNTKKFIQYKRIGGYLDDKEIKTESEFLFRVFEVLNLSTISYSSKFKGGYFANNIDEQQILADYYTSQAYQIAPILRNEFKWKQIEKRCQPRSKHSYAIVCHDVEKEYSLPLLLKVAKVAYSNKTGLVNESKVKSYINKSIDDSIQNTGNKLGKFCKANYINYKNDKNFKDMFKASSFLRATVKNPMGQDEASANLLNELDSAILKDIRSKSEEWNEDVFEPVLKVLGMAAIIALGIVLMIGTGGAATPGVLGGIYAAASLFLAAEFFISFPLVVGSLYARINTHFIETPASLKFQTSLAQSQVDFSKVVDWDMLKADKDSLKSKQRWTIGLMPLDFIYGAALLKHVRTSAGVVGKAAHGRLTGTKIKGWGAISSEFTNFKRFKVLRSEMGLPKALVQKAKDIVLKVKHYAPKYQPLPAQMLHGAPLRMGLAKKAKEIGISTKPWSILENVKEYESALRSRLTVFNKFVATEGKIIGKVRLNGKVGAREVLDHGLKYSSMSFIPKSYWKAFKDGKLLKYLKNNDDLWSELKHIQGKMVKGRADKIKTTADKIISFKKGIQSGAIAREGDDLMEQMLKYLKTDEILVLKEIANKGNKFYKVGSNMIGNFKSVFKDYNKVVQGLRPVGYDFGAEGVSFARNSAYPQNIMLGDEVSSKYAFKQDSEDLINYYESMMKHNGTLSEKSSALKRNTEEKISHYMTVDKNGKRTYQD